ncbi:MAG: YbaB/EbfC family nucleoid-associated protein [Candidatus Margulisbacteria bacterium]|nr:YbaB/EbfC family nucleoid-associated protein [Candidatus Margulisiibacteriota bacterium]
MIFGNMGEMMKMARDMQGQMKKIKEDLAKEIFEGSAPGVVVKISGDMELKELSIEPQLVNPNDVAKLEKQVGEAAKKALKLAKDGAAKKLKGLTGGLGLPGMF